MQQRNPERWQTSVPIPCAKCACDTRTGYRVRGRNLCPTCSRIGKRTLTRLAKARPRALNANGQRRIAGRRWRERTRPGIIARDQMCVWKAMGMPFSPACSLSGQFTADHIIPWHLGTHDEHDPTNLVGCCVECNYARSNRRLTPVQEQAALLIAEQRTAQMGEYPW